VAEQNGGVSLAVSCPRCGASLLPPSLTHSDWRCDECGPVIPLHVVRHPSSETVAAVCDRLSVSDSRIPLWCPWPLPTSWTITGLAWVGDERSTPVASVLVLSGPVPIGDGPADVAFVAEEPAVGLGMSLAGVTGTDPGRYVQDAARSAPPHAKVRASGHPAPLWAVATRGDRSAYVGEAMGLWLCVVTWPAAGGYLLAEALSLHDLTESRPTELVFGAPSFRLSRRTPPG
jgi:uncharacterized protein DUF6758